MQQSYIITKRYYQAMDTLVSEILMDCLDMAKIVYKKGLTGQIILGDQKTIFEVAPKYYTTTSFDIHLADSAEIIKEQEMIKQLAMQFAGSNLVDPETLFIMATSKSLTEMREAAIKSLREKKAENNQLQQLQQQLEEAQQNMQQMQNNLNKVLKSWHNSMRRNSILNSKIIKWIKNWATTKLRRMLNLRTESWILLNNAIS